MRVGSHKRLGYLQLSFARHTFLESWSQKGAWNTGVDTLTPRAYRSQPQERTKCEKPQKTHIKYVTKEESLLLSILKALSPSKTPWKEAPGYLHPQPRTFSWAYAPTPVLWTQQQQQLHTGPSSRGDVVSSCVMPYTDGNGNRKVGHLDPNLFPDWEPSSSICLLWQHHCQQATGDTGDGWLLSFGSCVTRELGTQDLEYQEPQYKG